MDLLEQAALVEDLEVAANGHVGDAELAHEVGDADRAVLADAIEDECLALAREHQATRLMPTRPSCSIPNDLPLLIDRLPPNGQKVNVFPQMSDMNALQILDTGVAGRDNPADPVGFCRAASEEEYAMADPTRDAVSRRTVLKGMAGAAGLVSVPAIIAACSTPAASGAPSAPPAATSGASAPAATPRASSPPAR